MTIKKASRIASCIILFAAALIVSAFFIIRAYNAHIPGGEIAYNQNPDLAKKFRPEPWYASIHTLGYRTIGDFTEIWDAVAIIKVLDNGTETTTKADISTLPATLTKVKILEQVAGEKISDQEILIFQLGAPSENCFHKKLAKGEKLLLPLSPFTHNNITVYSFPLYGEGTFYIDAFNKVTSMSYYDRLSARYDGLPLGALKKDFIAAYKSVNGKKATAEE